MQYITSAEVYADKLRIIKPAKIALTGGKILTKHNKQKNIEKRVGKFTDIWLSQVGFVDVENIFPRHAILGHKIGWQKKADLGLTYVGFQVGIAECQPEFTGL